MVKLFEESLLCCGVDEAGRGSLAGPVVAAAVVLSEGFDTDGLDDSKKLTRSQRNILFKKIKSFARVGVGFASVAEIDQLNILQATFLAMERSVASLNSKPRKILIDGNLVPPKLSYTAEAIVKGDSKVKCIAAASVVAKVTRDLYMIEKSKIYSGYGWEKNFGYGVKQHLEALDSFGVTPEHRRSFAPIYKMLC